MNFNKIFNLYVISSNFEYMERRPSDKQDIVSTYTLQDYPKDLQKKVTLLQHFRSYLEGDGKNSNVYSTSIFL